MTTAKGTAQWFKVNTTVNEFQGKEQGYEAPVLFDEKETKRLVELAKRTLKEAQESPDFQDNKGKPKKWMNEPFMPFSTDENGKTTFRFKCSHLLKDSEERRYVPVFDAKGTPIGHDVAIGNGSIVKVNFSPSAYHVNANVNGVKFFLNAIQVIDLVTFGNGTADAFGFDEEEGYEAPVTQQFEFEDVPI